MLRKLIVTAALTLLFLFSFWFAFLRTPEAFALLSDDDRLAAEGVSFRAKQLSLSSLFLPESPWSMYELKPEDIAKSAEGEIYLPAGLQEQEQLYAFDQQISAWRALSESDWVLGGRTRFALGPSLSMTAPSFEEEWEEIFTQAPEHAIGYQAFILARIEQIPMYFYLPQSMRMGGCDGVFSPARDLQQQVKRRTLYVPVNDVMREVEFSLVTQWAIDVQVQDCTLAEQE